MTNNCWLMFARGKLISATRQKSRAAAEIVYDYIAINKPSEALNLLANDPSIGSKMLGLALDPYAHFGYNYGEYLRKNIDVLKRIGNDQKAVQQLNNYVNYYSNTTTHHLNKISNDDVNELMQTASINTIDGIYATVALAATGKATYGYNPRKIREINGYRLVQNTVVFQNHDMVANNSTFSYKIIPNPASSFVEIQFEDKLPNRIEITDATGKAIYSSNVQSNNLIISLADIATGFYIIKAINGNNTSDIKKLVVLK